MMERDSLSRSDRRRYDRIRATFSFIIRGLHPDAEVKKEFVAHNISAGGIFFNAPAKSAFQQGKVLKVDIAPPEHVTAEFPFSRLVGKAKVVRIEDIARASESGVGVALEFNPAEMDYLLS